MGHGISRKAEIPGLENKKKTKQSWKQNFRQHHAQNQCDEDSVAFVLSQKGILETLLQKRNVTTIDIATKRNSWLCFLVSPAPDFALGG